MVSTSIRRMGCVGAALALVSCFAARAEAHGAETAIPVLVVAALLPSEAGVAIATDGTSRANGLIGWSWQVPLGRAWTLENPHRIVGGVDLLPHSGGASWRGRLGYRYDTGRVLFGAGPAIDGAGLSLSPEVGLKFLHLEHRWPPSLHAIARAEVAPDGLRGATLMLGWNVL